jgi:hypothetical protein
MIEESNKTRERDRKRGVLSVWLFASHNSKHKNWEMETDLVFEFLREKRTVALKREKSNEI